MTPIRVDPEATETRRLHEHAGGFAGRRVVEVGCGDGRLTWRFAGQAAHVLAFDPDEARVARAVAARPAHLAQHVHFATGTLRTLPAPPPPYRFDIALLSWSL
jgi:2-polyprenyl-3-methyl-5-hydroxy-6-metoxy-1,4-benzoquinol methylase